MGRLAAERPARPALFVWPSELPAIVELATTPHWTCWRYRWREDGKGSGKWTKPPIDPKTGRYADHGDERTWGTLQVARQRYADDPTVDGVGFVVTNDFTVIDLDDCLDTTTGRIVRPEAAQIVEELQSYTERTPSGTGLRVIVRGRLPDTFGNRKAEIGLEVYSVKRYVTVSGRHLEGTPTEIVERQPELERIVLRFIGERKSKVTPPLAAAAQTTTVGMDDEAILARCRSVGTGVRFLRLWGGDMSDFPARDGESGKHLADLSLCSLLAFWTDDASQIDRLFRRSGLYRQKWERDAYRDDTIEKALNRVDRYRGHRGEDSDADLWAALADPAPPVDVEPTNLEVVVEIFRRWLQLDDLAPVYAVLGSVAANYQAHRQGIKEPLWLQLVGPSSGGKTAILESLERLPTVHIVGAITEAGLLSGTPKRDVEKGSTGGLLREVGEFGIMVSLDFTAAISQHKEVQAQTLSALRDIYGGLYIRRLGQGGGIPLEWRGKVGFIGGVTEAIEEAHSVNALMGERFVYCRLPDVGEETEAQIATFALEHDEEYERGREEMRLAVYGLFASMDWSHRPAELTKTEQDYLVAVAQLSARCRSAVKRDGTKRDILLVPRAERPTRLTLILKRLYNGMRAIGIPEREAWRIVAQIGLDSMPSLRRRVFDHLATTGWQTTTQVETAVDHPNATTRRALEDLQAHRVIERLPAEEAKKRADQWRLSPWARRLFAAIQAGVPSDSEICEDPLSDHNSVGEENQGDPFFMHSSQLSGEVTGAGEQVPPPVAADWAATDRPPCDHCGEAATHHYRDPEAWLCLGCAVGAGFVAEDTSPVDELGGVEGEEGEG